MGAIRWYEKTDVITSFSGLGRTGFVKRNVTVLADTAEEEFDTAVRLDDSLICIAFRDEVGCIAIENMYLRGGYVNLETCEGLLA